MRYFLIRLGLLLGIFFFSKSGRSEEFLPSISKSLFFNALFNIQASPNPCSKDAKLKFTITDIPNDNNRYYVFIFDIIGNLKFSYAITPDKNYNAILELPANTFANTGVFFYAFGTNKSSFRQAKRLVIRSTQAN